MTSFLAGRIVEELSRLNWINSRRGSRQRPLDLTLLRGVAEAIDPLITPTPMLLWCPECGDRHIDVGEFATKPHHTHACQSCGHVWRPALVNTVGVRFLPGFRTAGLIDYGAGSTVFLTDSGRAASLASDAPPTAAALQDSIMRRLSPAKARILQALIRVYPQGLARDALADLASQSATSSSYANNLGSLRSLGLIDYRGGEVIALPVLFLEGA